MREEREGRESVRGGKDVCMKEIDQTERERARGKRGREESESE